MEIIRKSILFMMILTIGTIHGLDQACQSYNLTNLDIDKYHFYFRTTHLEQTLYCVGYKRYQPPSGNVSLIRHLEKLINVDEDGSTIRMYEKMYLEYHDDSLDFSPLQGTKRIQFHGKESVSLFWNPDFDPSEDTMFQPVFNYVLLHLSGLVQISRTDQVNQIHCQMKYHWFPFDTQTCLHPIIIDEAKTIEYNETNVFAESTIEQVWHPDWSVQLQRDQCQIIDKQCFSIKIVLHRKTSDFLLHTFVPSMMLSIASGASLFIPRDYMPARMGLSVTTCLSAITLFVSAQKGWPDTAYLKAIDVWVIMCYSAVFYSLLEYTIILSLSKVKIRIVDWIERVSRILLPLYITASITVYFYVIYNI